MVECAYALNFEDYTVKNALLWGNFVGHCKKVKGSDWRGRTIHIIIAALEIIPIVGQIVSLFEMYMCKYRISTKDTKKIDSSSVSCQLENPVHKPVLSRRSITGNSTAPLVVSTQENIERIQEQPKEQVIRLKIEVVTRNEHNSQVPAISISRATPIQSKNDMQVPVGFHSDIIPRSDSIPATILIADSHKFEEDEKELAHKKPLSLKTISVTPDELVIPRTPTLRNSIVFSDAGSVQEGIPVRSKSAPAILSPNVENPQAFEMETDKMTSSFISVSEEGIEEGQKKIEKQIEKEKENA